MGQRMLQRLDLDPDYAPDPCELRREILKMQDQIMSVLQWRWKDPIRDRIAEIHPSGCVPHVKSKPKSRLKTDRVKKVK